MDSLFHREPVARPLTIYERLAPEIVHLQKRASTRHGKGKPGGLTTWLFVFAIGAALWLFFMDPFVYALKRSEAIRAYLYLHSYDSDASVQALLSTRILSENEVILLNRKAGNYQDYFSNHQDAEAEAASIVAYMNSLRTLHEGPPENLDPIGKLRYFLFIRSGLIPPTSWSGLNPSVE